MMYAMLLARANDAVFNENPDIQLVKDMRKAIVTLEQEIRDVKRFAVAYPVDL